MSVYKYKSCLLGHKWGFVLTVCQLSVLQLVSLLSRWCGLWNLSPGWYEGPTEMTTSLEHYAQMPNEHAEEQSGAASDFLWVAERAQKGARRTRGKTFLPVFAHTTLTYCPSAKTGHQSVCVDLPGTL